MDVQDSLTLAPTAASRGSKEPRCAPIALSILLICGLALGLAGCSGKKATKTEAVSHYSQQLREVVSTSVLDEGRKAEMLSTVDRLETLQVRFSDDTAKFLEAYRTLNADYNAQRSAFDQLFSDFTATRMKARDEALALHFRLASLATVGEWKPIAKAETELYEEVDAGRPAGVTEK